MDVFCTGRDCDEGINLINDEMRITSGMNLQVVWYWEILDEAYHGTIRKLRYQFGLMYLYYFIKNKNKKRKKPLTYYERC